MAIKFSRLVKGEVRAETPNGTEHTPFGGWNGLQNGANRSDNKAELDGFGCGADGGRGVDRKMRRGGWGW
jgi:hypothetical protein